VLEIASEGIAIHTAGNSPDAAIRSNIMSGITDLQTVMIADR
jgi:hypothetical protein